MAKYNNVFLDKETYEKLHKLATENGRSLVGQVRWMLDHYVEIHDLPHPEDAEPVPLVEVEMKS